MSPMRCLKRPVRWPRRSGAKTGSVEDVIAAKDVDAILIATPTDTHADLIEQAAKAGKMILCEKPVSLSVERIEECLKVVEKAGVPLMIGFHRRYDPNYSVLEKRLRAGEIGDVEIVTIICRDPTPPPVSYIERSGGLYRDMMIHDFDMARFLLGEDPVTVHALGASLVDPAIGKAGDIDTAAVHMQTASGKMCVITNSRRATYGHDQRIEVHGSKGMLRAGNMHLTTLEKAEWRRLHQRPDPVLLHRTLRGGLSHRDQRVPDRDRKGRGADALPAMTG